MSDYLTRLIERSLGAAPQIQPLIAPLHAPHEQILSEETQTIATFGLGSTEKIESLGHETTPGDDPNGRTSEAAFSRRGRQRPIVSHPLPESSAGFPSATSDESSGPRPRIPSRPASLAPTPEALDPASSPLPPSMVSPESLRRVVQPEVIEPSGPAAAAEEPPPLPNGRRRMAVQPEIAGHRKTPASSTAARQQSSSNQPPAIHVTIGRVEVRAVLPPKATPKIQVPAAPKLSLEAYLKQRNRTSL